MTNDGAVKEDPFRVVTSRRKKKRGVPHFQRAINVEVNLNNSNIDEDSVKK